MTLAMSNWAALSGELWAKIFNYMQPVLHCQYTGDFCNEMPKLRRLSEVCTSFRTILVQHPHIKSAMLLPEEFKDDALLVMMQYIQQHHACLQTVVSDCNPHVRVCSGCTPISPLFRQGSAVGQLPIRSCASGQDALACPIQIPHHVHAKPECWMW